MSQAEEKKLLTELELACPGCEDSTIMYIEEDGLTESGEDQVLAPILRCRHGCRLLVTLQLIERNR